MKVKIVDDDIIVESEHPLKAPFLGRYNGKGYRIYWHFIKDVAETFGGVSKSVKADLVKKIEERKQAMRILTDEEYEPFDYSDYFTNEYRRVNFQARGSDFILKQKKVLLADDVGLGKTIITISTILRMIDEGEASRFIIVVPASLRLQWLSEFRKFVNTDKFPDIRYFVQGGEGKKKRVYNYKRYSEPGGVNVMILSYAVMRIDKDIIQKLDYDMVVFDEATSIKNRSTKSNKTARELFIDAERKLALTATPIENGLEDLYCICEWIDSRRLRTKKYFEHRYCNMQDKKIWQGRGRFVVIREVTGYKNLPDARQKLSGMYIRRTINDVALELPRVITQTIMLEMTKKQKKLYAEIKGDIFGKETKIDLFGQLVYLQETCDAPYLITKDGKGAKLREVKRLLADDLKYQKVVMITKFKKYAKLIHGEINKSNAEIITGDTSHKDRQFIIDNFSSTDGQAILIGTEAIEEGLNLQAGSVIINLDLPWNPAKLKQRLGRIQRIGSEHTTVRMINLVMEDTIEDRVIEILYEKGKLFERMFESDEGVKIHNLLDLKEATIKELI